MIDDWSTTDGITYAQGEEITSKGYFPGLKSWQFTADGTEIGRIDENRYGYRGRLYGPGGDRTNAAFTGASLPLPSSVVDQLTRAARRRGITGR